MRINNQLLCVILVLCLLSGCSAPGRKADVELTEEQEARIDLIVEHRDEWKEINDTFVSYPVTRLHIYESENFTFLTVAYAEDENSTIAGGQVTEVIYSVCGYAVTDDTFTATNNYYKYWSNGCITVDLENMSDIELREAVKESYISFLSKE